MESYQDNLAAQMVLTQSDLKRNCPSPNRKSQNGLWNRSKRESRDKHAQKDIEGEGDRMAWQAPEGMDECLKPTNLCDCENERVKEKAQELIKGAQSPKEAATRIFHFVRDEILFGGDVVDAKASDALKRGVGLCMSKAI